ncbi:MAG TPA: carbamoyltransferase HypF [Coriobacteriaceae bacterium]|nr:carbamoyltransferase HypF [Coriobacteriaceae bacterium]
MVSPDLATCDACVEELFDPGNRRYHYPFINCTNCGPRFTIIEELPYDRPRTSMAPFAMCPQCAAEYADETDRRYHAQPDACFECGPRLWWIDANAETLSFDDDGALILERQHLTREESDAIIAEAYERLRAGDVLAIKGLGGWHLACDASNEKAVERLRTRKRRPSKPLAVMVRDVSMARRYARVSNDEAVLLESPARPIVLLERMDGFPIAANVAEDLPEIGLMLPATPLQHLLMDELRCPLVMTSGNRSGEPIVATDADALDALRAIADSFLGNNRAIVARYDDSVMRIDDRGETQMIRRARGYAPAPLLLACNRGQAPVTYPAIFAAGPEQKATFALCEDERVYVTQHLGDLEHRGTMRAWHQARERYEQLFDTHPQVIVCDMHPEYLASKWAREYAREHDLPLIEVQHHHAHIASVLGENKLQDPVIGIALDGTGYGTDGTIWGGEILIATRGKFERFWHLPGFSLPGGAAAILNPERTAYALLKAYDELDDAFFGQFSLDNPQFACFLERLENRTLLDQMIEKGINSPLCSSTGRLFDAASALLGICTHPGYDGEAACLLEAAAWRNDDEHPLTARAFHEGLINAIIEQTLRARSETGINDIALSGGCMVNRILFSQLRERLGDLGFTVYINRELPPNDGCISYGQAIVACARLEE